GLAKEVSEQTALQAFQQVRSNLEPIFAALDEAASVGKAKRQIPEADEQHDVLEQVSQRCQEPLKQAMLITEKQARHKRLDEIEVEALHELHELAADLF